MDQIDQTDPLISKHLAFLAECSPHPAPVKAGQIAILTEPSNLKGFCVEVVSTNNSQEARVRLLDSEPDQGLKTVWLYSLIPTGKTPADLMSRFEPTDHQLAEALDKERSAPDYNALSKKRKATSKKPQKTLEEELAGLTQLEKSTLAQFIKSQLAKKGD